MKDSEFLELLNLYLDHEIGKEDSARLEAEVLRNPERRRIYRQYCQMQKACVLLSEGAMESAPAEDTALAAAFAPRRSSTGGLWALGAFAAAACAAIVVARLRLAEHSSPAVAPAASSVQVAASPASATFAVPSAAQDFRPVFVARPAAVRAEVADANQFAWMNRIELSPIQSVSVDKLFAEPKRALFDSRTTSPGQSVPVETAAFQFDLDR